MANLRTAKYEYTLNQNDLNLLNEFCLQMFGLNDVYEMRIHRDNGYWQADVKALRE